MSLNTGEIQPIASGPWVAPETERKEVQVIAPVAKAEGGTSSKIGDDKTKNDTSGTLSQGFSDEVAKQLQSMLGDTTSLMFQVDAKGGTVVKVLDRKTGEIIRQIPAENMVKIQQKLEELRGILFDDKV